MYKLNIATHSPCRGYLWLSNHSLVCIFIHRLLIYIRHFPYIWYIVLCFYVWCVYMYIRCICRILTGRYQLDNDWVQHITSNKSYITLSLSYPLLYVSRGPFHKRVSIAIQIWWKYGYGLMTSYWITTRLHFLRIWIMRETSFVKRTPDSLQMKVWADAILITNWYHSVMMIVLNAFNWNAYLCTACDHLIWIHIFSICRMPFVYEYTHELNWNGFNGWSQWEQITEYSEYFEYI